MTMKLFFLLFLCINSLLANDVKVLDARYLLDANHTYKVENIYAQKEKFSPLDYKNTSFGYRNDTLWIYLKVKSTVSYDASNVIKFIFNLHDYVYVLQYCHGEIVDQYLTGDLTKHSTRKLDVNSLVIPYNLKAGEEKEFIFQIDSKSNLNVGMQFLTKEEFFKDTNYMDVTSAFYYGAVFIMLLYNLFLYFIIKEKAYIYYVIFHLFLLLSHLSSNGYTFTLFWPNSPEINSYFLPCVFMLANYYSIIFMLSFLNLQEYSLRLYYFFKFLAAIFLVSFFGVFFIGYAIIDDLMIVSLFSVVSLLFAGVYILVKYKTPSAKFFVVAWGFLLLGVVMEELESLGALPANPMFAYASQVGTFMELILLSFALAYRYNIVFKKLQVSESEVKMLNAGLQEKVNEQTKDLKLLIKEMHHRVKNNFQVIITFLWAQKRSIKEEQSIRAMEYTIQRIYAISSIHEQLNVSEKSSIDIEHYIKEMINSFKTHQDTVEYRLNIENPMLGYDEAITIGLILNELLTNSDKYAFDDVKEPCISIDLTLKDDSCIFVYSDNGPGFDVSSLSQNSGMGYDLIHGFVAKNNAKIFITSENGLSVTITFPKGKR